MDNLKIVYVPINDLKKSEYNPRKWSEAQTSDLRESITRFGCVDPLLANNAPGRENILIGGHFRLQVATELGYKEIPVVYVNIPDIEKEKELNLRLNKNLGEFDFTLLKDFGEEFLCDVGFTTEELDLIFDVDTTPEQFDLKRELEKMNIEVTVQKGDRYEIDGSIVMCGDSTVEADMLKLMEGVKADLCFTDPPYILDYLRGKTKQKDGVTTGFGAKKNRRYLETESLPDNFTDLWMDAVSKVQKPDFSIIVFENPKNLRIIWNALEKYWKYRNTIVWHVGNRMQGFSAKYKFFNKHDIALVGTGGEIEMNLDPETEPLFQNEYENALFATTGSPTWESYGKGKKYCPTDFITHIAADKKSSGQDIIFGTKPLELLIPYIKVLTKRDDLVLDPFGGSGSTLIASLKLGRKCRMMEKSPVYMEIIKQRWEKFTGKKAIKIN